MELVKETASAATTSNTSSWRGAPLSERMTWKARFLAHPRAQGLVDTIAERVDACRWSNAGDGMLVVGATGSGKTRLVKHLCEHYGKERKDLAERSIRPAISLTIPNPCRPRELAAKILRQLGDPIAERSRVSEVTDRAQRLLVDCETRIVLIDNFHDVPLLRKERGVEHICNWVRDLIDAVPALFVLLGNKDIEPVLVRNEQLHRRCAHFSQLHYFSANTADGFKEFALLIRNLEARLPLAERSALMDRQVLLAIFAASGGIFSYLLKLLDAAILSAVKDSREYIEPLDLMTAFNMVHGDAYRGCNPFVPGFSPRILNCKGEPFERLLAA